MQVGYFGDYRTVAKGSITLEMLGRKFDPAKLKPFELNGPMKLVRGGLSGNDFFTIKVGGKKFFVKIGTPNELITSISRDAIAGISLATLPNQFRKNVILPSILVQDNNTWYLVYPKLPKRAQFPSETGWKLGDPTKVVEALNRFFYTNSLPLFGFREPNGSKQRLIHGDVTPSNVAFVDGEVKFIDIGTASYGDHEIEIISFLSYVYGFVREKQQVNPKLAVDLQAEILELIRNWVQEPIQKIEEHIADEPNWIKVTGQRKQVRLEYLEQLQAFRKLLLDFHRSSSPQLSD